MLNNRFNVADLNAIETRVAAWVSGCQPLMDVFTTYVCVDHPEATLRCPGRCKVCNEKLEQMCPYLDFATKMYNIPYHQLARDYKSKDPEKKAAAKDKRQIAKPGVLGCVYRLSGGELIWKFECMGCGFKWSILQSDLKEVKCDNCDVTNPSDDGESAKTGLWAYSENMGVDMSRDKAHEVVKIFRNSYVEIVQMWYALEKLAISVLTDKPITSDDPQLLYALGRLKQIGIEMDKIVVNDHGTQRVIFRIKLPSGRFLHYLDAEVEDLKKSWTNREGKDVYKPTITYSGKDQVTGRWRRGIETHGGKIFENIVQGIARDVLAECLLIFEKLGMMICGHVHDEGISETPDDPFLPGSREMEHIMSQPIDWAPGLPLGADGFEDRYYHK